MYVYICLYLPKLIKINAKKFKYFKNMFFLIITSIYSKRAAYQKVPRKGAGLNPPLMTEG